MREPGYYWIKLKYHQDWEVANCFGGDIWSVLHSSIEEIDEKQIIRKEE